MLEHILYIGLDVHADSISVALAAGERGGEVRLYGKVSSDLQVLEKLLRKLGHPEKALRVCYEAGPCGFVIARRLRQLKIDCTVVAPSLTPKGKGDRIKTDRRDALMLARLHRAGEPRPPAGAEIDSRLAAPQGRTRREAAGESTDGGAYPRRARRSHP